MVFPLSGDPGHAIVALRAILSGAVHSVQYKQTLWFIARYTKILLYINKAHDLEASGLSIFHRTQILLLLEMSFMVFKLSLRTLYRGLQQWFRLERFMSLRHINNNIAVIMCTLNHCRWFIILQRIAAWRIVMQNLMRQMFLCPNQTQFRISTYRVKFIVTADIN